MVTVGMNISPLFVTFTLEVTLATAFGRDIGLEIDENNLLFKTLDSILNAVWRSGSSQTNSANNEKLHHCDILRGLYLLYSFMQGGQLRSFRVTLIT